MKLSGVLSSVVPSVLAVLALAGGLAVYNHGQREIGRRDLELEISRHQLAQLQPLRDSLARAFRPETVRFTKWRRIYDSSRVRGLEQLLDSLRAAGVSSPETVRVAVPVRVLVAADSTITACSETLPTCREIHRTDSLAIDGLRQQLRAVSVGQASALHTWADRLAWGYAGSQLGCLAATGRFCLALGIRR